MPKDGSIKVLFSRQGHKEAMSPASAGKPKRRHREEPPKITQTGIQLQRQEPTSSAMLHGEVGGWWRPFFKKEQHEKSQDKDS